MGLKKERMAQTEHHNQMQCSTYMYQYNVVFAPNPLCWTNKRLMERQPCGIDPVLKMSRHLHSPYAAASNKE